MKLFQRQLPPEDLLFTTFKNNSFQSLQNNSISDVCLNNFMVDKTSFGLNKSSRKKKCFVCGSKLHLIKDCDFHEKRMGVSVPHNRPRPKWANVHSKPSCIPQATRTTSRTNSVSADRSVPAGGSVSASRYFISDRNRYVARPFSGYHHNYFQNGYWPGCYDPMFLGRVYWDSVVKSSADCSWKFNRPYEHRGSRNNGGSNSSTWLHSNDPQGRLKSFKT